MTKPAIITIDSLSIKFQTNLTTLNNFIMNLANETPFIKIEVNKKTKLMIFNIQQINADEDGYKEEYDDNYENIKGGFLYEQTSYKLKVNIFSSITNKFITPKIQVSFNQRDTEGLITVKIDFKGIFDYQALAYNEIYYFIKELNHAFKVSITRLDIAFDYRHTETETIKISSLNKSYQNSELAKQTHYLSNACTKKDTSPALEKSTELKTNTYCSIYSYDKSAASLYCTDSKKPKIKRIEYSFRKQIKSIKESHDLKSFNQSSINHLITMIEDKKVLANNEPIQAHLALDNLTQIFNYINGSSSAINHLYKQAVTKIEHSCINKDKVFLFLKKCSLKDYIYANKKHLSPDNTSLNVSLLLKEYSKNEVIDKNLFSLLLTQYFTTDKKTHISRIYESRRKFSIPNIEMHHTEGSFCTSYRLNEKKLKYYRYCILDPKDMKDILFLEDQIIIELNSKESGEDYEFDINPNPDDIRSLFRLLSSHIIGRMVFGNKDKHNKFMVNVYCDTRLFQCLEDLFQKKMSNIFKEFRSSDSSNCISIDI